MVAAFYFLYNSLIKWRRSRKMKLLKWMKEPKKIKKPNEQTDLEKTEFGLQVLQQTQEFFLIY